MNDLEGIYDKEAVDYDGKYQSETHLMEDEIISLSLRGSIEPSDTVLDLGCGTGSAIDYGQIPSSKYTGIDLSKGMVDLAVKKHPNHKFIHGDITSILDVGRFDYISAVYGQVNYVGIDCFCDILDKHGYDNFKYMAVMYNQKNEADYGYTTSHQKHFAASEVLLKMSDRGYAPIISGFSWNAPLEGQWDKTKVSGSLPVSDDWDSKYIIVSNFLLGGDA